MSKQHTVWFRADRHSRAHSTLTTARSLRMAETLNIGDPSQNQRCTGCHAPIAGLEAHQKASTARPEEGVSCESCHGPASSWVRSHTRPDYTRKQRISSGMRDLEDPYLRANTCVACHQVLSSDLIAAGHPRLHFDLAALSDREPRHWQEIWRNPQLWTIGQLATLRELSGTLGQLQKPGAEELADGESTLWICRILLKHLPAGPDPLPLPDAFKPGQDLTKACDRLARQKASAHWEKDWNRLLLTAFQAEISPLSNSQTDSPAFHFRLIKLHSALRVFTGEMNPELQSTLEPLLEKLKQCQTLSKAEAMRQLPAISKSFAAALQTHP